MFLILVCLFVMMSPYRTALKPVFSPHWSPDAYICKYRLKFSYIFPDILGNNSCFHKLKKERRRRKKKNPLKVHAEKFCGFILTQTNCATWLPAHRFTSEVLLMFLVLPMLRLWCVICESVVRDVTQFVKLNGT